MKGENQLKILIIGGTGILSSETCNLAIQKGFCVTTLNRGNRPSFQNPHAKLILCDIRKESAEEIQNKLGGVFYDVVVDFLSYTKLDLEKLLNAVRHHCKQYIFISTATVYKVKEAGHRYIETDETGNDLWSYSYQKSECEWFLQQHSAFYTDSYTIIRPYVTFGNTRIPYQFSPGEYYTLIHRLKAGKPLPIYQEQTICTLTDVNTFAVGLVGIFGNRNALNEAFHITSDCTTTWKNVISIIGRYLNKKALLVPVDKNILLSINGLGLDCGELLGDKGRNMIFDNQKIKNTAAEFTGHTDLEKMLLSSVQTLENNQALQAVNYMWDGVIDRLLATALKHGAADYSGQFSKKALSFSGKCNIKNLLSYEIGRRSALYSAAKTFKNLKKRRK